MSQTKKILLGIATVWPFVYFVIFFALVLILMLLAPNIDPAGLPIGFIILFGFHFLTIVLIWVLFIIYLIHVFNNEKLDKQQRILWAVLMFIGNFIAMPAYWYLHIWKEENHI